MKKINETYIEMDGIEIPVTIDYEKATVTLRNGKGEVQTVAAKDITNFYRYRQFAQYHGVVFPVDFQTQEELVLHGIEDGSDINYQMGFSQTAPYEFTKRVKKDEVEKSIFEKYDCTEQIFNVIHLKQSERARKK